MSQILGTVQLEDSTDHAGTSVLLTPPAGTAVPAESSLTPLTLLVLGVALAWLGRRRTKLLPWMALGAAAVAFAAMQTVSDSDGNYSFAGAFAPGLYRLDFTHEGYAPASAEVLLRHGNDAVAPSVLLHPLSTPTPSPTPSPTPTDTPTSPPTETSTATQPPPTPSISMTPTETSTATQTATRSRTPTKTPFLTRTRTPTAPPTATLTPTLTSPPTATPTVTPTATPSMTSTPAPGSSANLGPARVWLDYFENGVYDANEPGLAGVIVTLYTIDGVFLGTSVTDANGFYTFQSLVPGTYYLEFEDPTTIPGGNEFWYYAQQDIGNDDNIDSDVENAPGATYGQTAPFTLAPNQTRTNIMAGYDPNIFRSKN